jgi:hypothetical protein
MALVVAKILQGQRAKKIHPDFFLPGFAIIANQASALINNPIIAAASTPGSQDTHQNANASTKHATAVKCKEPLETLCTIRLQQSAVLGILMYPHVHCGSCAPSALHSNRAEGFERFPVVFYLIA